LEKDTYHELASIGTTSEDEGAEQFITDAWQEAQAKLEVAESKTQDLDNKRCTLKGCKTCPTHNYEGGTKALYC
jgi:hypothetical protein